MVLFCAMLTLLVDDVALLTSFGFKRESYAMSSFVCYLVWRETIEYWIEFLYRYLQRKDETEADTFAVEHGYGKHLKMALIRNFGANLDNIFISWLDAMLNTSHPPLLQRLDLIEDAISNTLFEEPLELYVADEI